MQYYLYADEPYTNRSAYPFPDLLLLDLQMPVMDGFEVLAGVKGRPELKSVTIAVLSSVDDSELIYKALKLGAKDFLIKPVSMKDRIEMVREIHSRWLKNICNPASRAKISIRGPSACRSLTHWNPKSTNNALGLF
jgi:CheY-like chemotaxis protein